jgi:hypothetical protein
MKELFIGAFSVRLYNYLKDREAFDASHWLELQACTPNLSTSQPMSVFSFLLI